MTNPAVMPPPDPHDFGWLIDNFAASTPGVTHALIVSSDGLPLIASRGIDFPSPYSVAAGARTISVSKVGHDASTTGRPLTYSFYEVAVR